MRGSAARDAWLGPPELLEPQKVWPEDQEKSPKKRRRRPGYPTRIRYLSGGANVRPSRCSVGRDTGHADAISTTYARGAAAKRGSSENYGELQLGHSTRHGQGPLRQPRSGLAARRISRV